MTSNPTYLGLYDLLLAQAYSKPHHTAVIVNQQKLTFNELNIKAKQVAASLYQMGIRQGDRVGLLMPPSIEWMAVFWGVQALGAVCVPMAPGEGREEIANIFELSDVKVCFAPRRFQVNEFEILFRELKSSLSALRQVIITQPHSVDEFVLDFETVLRGAPQWRDDMLPLLQPTDLYALMATSGTTGVPKLIPKQHQSNIQYLTAYDSEYPTASTDVFFSAMPPCHMLSLSFMLICMMSGATVMFQSFFSPDEMLQQIASTPATVVLLSATNAKMMLALPDFNQADLSGTETFIFSGEFLPDEVAGAFYQQRPFRVRNIIGSTEVSAYLVWDSHRDAGHSVSALTPLKCVETALMNEDGTRCAVGARAEIFVSHGDILKSYFRNPEATALAIVTSTTGKNWFRTGDLAIPRPDGRYQFAGRIKRIIKRGATLIYPEEEECFLMTHPDITAAAIIGESDDTAGESIKAFIEVRPGATLTPIEVMRFCQGRLANIKIPETIVMVDELPRESGKIQLKKLREA
ncbi:MAG: acyl--CoA ligase [Deltaproteobacteria bacterium]|nr:acyl--CoA ligase [Deltaproteobacteria bacterium]